MLNGFWATSISLFSVGTIRVMTYDKHWPCFTIEASKPLDVADDNFDMLEESEDEDSFDNDDSDSASVNASDSD